MRTIIRTPEFNKFFESLKPKVQEKILYAIDVLQEITVLSNKLVKKLVESDYYELRIPMDNEYRIIIFSVDHKNIIQTSQILLLNGFIKKSTKDYKKQIEIANHIINRLK